MGKLYGYFLSFGTIPFLALHRIVDELLKTMIRTHPFVDLNVFFNRANQCFSDKLKSLGHKQRNFKITHGLIVVGNETISYLFFVGYTPKLTG